jgi:hypothetical protein
MPDITPSPQRSQQKVSNLMLTYLRMFSQS